MIIAFARGGPSPLAVGAVLCACAAACGGGSSTTPVAPSTSVVLNLPTAGASITSCSAMVAPGAYTLAADVGSGAQTTCLYIASSGITLDCGRHVISGFVKMADGLSNVTVTNCTMLGAVQPSNASNVTISNSTMTGTLIFTSSTNITIDHNHISLTGARPSAAIIIAGGSQNRVTNNVIDGGYHGQDLTGQGGDAPGADDGVLLADATNDTVQGNTISNVFDAGVEGVNAVRNSTIADNTIVNATEAGISSYHCTSWQGNKVTGNSISQSQHAALFNFTSDSLCFNFPNPTPSGSFSNNLFANNVLRNLLGTSLVAMSLVFLATVPESAVTGNVIQGNDFGSADVTVAPAGGFTSGGGNTCGTQGNFAC